MQHGTGFLMDVVSNSIDHTHVMENKRPVFVEKTKTDGC